MDLVSLTEGESVLLVRVPGRHMPGVLPWHGFLDAAITVRSGSGRPGPWSEAVATPAAGADARWTDDGRNPGIRFEHAGEGSSGLCRCARRAHPAQLLGVALGLLVHHSRWPSGPSDAVSGPHSEIPWPPWPTGRGAAHGSTSQGSRPSRSCR
ncbi:DUF5959 family protein [Streptomyces sp. PA03-3a]|nr:DUF5959 family protein [Streptomyces sp. PA03-3a]